MRFALQSIRFCCLPSVSPPLGILSELAARSEFSPTEVLPYRLGMPTLPLGRFLRLCGFSPVGIAGYS
jgi:hypothetical protein